MNISFIRKISWAIGVLIAAWAVLLPHAALAEQLETVNSPQIEAQVLQIIRTHPEVLLESLTAYQIEQDRQKQHSRDRVLERFKQSPQVLGHSPTTGAANGKMLIVEFSDFQCPFCAKAHTSLQQLVAERPNVQLVYKHLPLVSIHDQALPAALAAWAAGAQGKFWDYHDALFSQQSQLGEALYLNAARSLGLDLDRFNHDRQSKAAIAAITSDTELAKELGIAGTPSFVVTYDDNVKLFSGSDLSPITAALDRSQLANSEIVTK